MLLFTDIVAILHFGFGFGFACDMVGLSRRWCNAIKSRRRCRHIEKIIPVIILVVTTYTLYLRLDFSIGESISNTMERKMQQELLSTTRQPYKYNDWRAALRTMGAVADASGNEEVLNSDQAQSHFLSKKGNDVVTFSSFIDAFRFAPQATFGTLLATCTKAFENEELPGTLLRSNTNSSTVSFITHVTNTSEVKAQVSQLKVYEQHLQSTIRAPPLLTDDFTQRFLGSSRNNGTHGAAVDKDIHFTSGGENIVWILAGHINGEAVRYAEEAMHSRMRLYPKSRIILVDNGSPSNEQRSCVS